MWHPVSTRNRRVNYCQASDSGDPVGLVASPSSTGLAKSRGNDRKEPRNTNGFGIHPDAPSLLCLADWPAATGGCRVAVINDRPVRLRS
jgi:hypothetical protein